MEFKVVENCLKEVKLIVVICLKDKQEVCQQIESLLDKGICVVEVMYMIFGVLDIIEFFCNREDILIGVGMVISVQ